MPRAIWSGAISFGLVSVPVRLFTATESKELKFHFLDRRDMSPIGYDKVNKDTGKHVEPDDVIRGFEFEKGRFVELEDEDIDRLDIELTHAIDICDFVSIDEIDPLYFRKAYYLLPQEGAEKPYRLLVKALEETGPGRDREDRHPQQAAPLMRAPGRQDPGARDDVLRRRGAAARGRPGAAGAPGRGRDGEVADREPRLHVGPEALPRPVPQSAPRPAREEGGGRAAAGAAAGDRRRGDRPDGRAAPVGRRDQEEAALRAKRKAATGTKKKTAAARKRKAS